uniref:Putative secreted peptide n=1 Tax=Anopheles braziliensis TaxID=58242 RepID=A0A2M3ZT26_9DIPT
MHDRHSLYGGPSFLSCLLYLRGIIATSVAYLSRSCSLVCLKTLHLFDICIVIRRGYALFSAPALLSLPISLSLDALFALQNAWRATRRYTTANKYIPPLAREGKEEGNAHQVAVLSPLSPPPIHSLRRSRSRLTT